MDLKAGKKKLELINRQGENARKEMEKKIMIKNKSQYTCTYGKVRRGKFMNSKAKTL